MSTGGSRGRHTSSTFLSHDGRNHAQFQFLTNLCIECQSIRYSCLDSSLCPNIFDVLPVAVRNDIHPLFIPFLLTAGQEHQCFIHRRYRASKYTLITLIQALDSPTKPNSLTLNLLSIQAISFSARPIHQILIHHPHPPPKINTPPAKTRSQTRMKYLWVFSAVVLASQIMDVTGCLWRGRV